MTHSTLDIHDRIREILLNDWDPSDVARSEHARGAYDSYLAPLSELIERGNEQLIVDYLQERERETMCFPGLGTQRLRSVARKLLNLRQGTSN